jgi:hypothetical protein
VKAKRAGAKTWMLMSDSGQCQPLKYLKKNRETAPVMLARIQDVDRNGPSLNQELFRWLDAHKHGGHRACEYKVHHPRPCRAYAFQTARGFVIVRIEDKTANAPAFNATMRAVKATFDRFLKEGERYE